MFKELINKLKFKKKQLEKYEEMKTKKYRDEIRLDI